MTYDEVLERLNEERTVNPTQTMKKRKVWVAEWHLPGCLSEARSYCSTKADAVECALSFLPEGVKAKTALTRYGKLHSSSPLYGTCITTVTKHTIGDLI